MDPGSLEEFAKPEEAFRVRPKTLAHREEIVSDPQEIAALGHGGLLSREMAYRFPPYRAGAARGELE